MQKTELRNKLFEKFFEVKDGIYLKELLEHLSYITQTYQKLDKLLKKHIEDYDSFNYLEFIKCIKYYEEKYLIIKTGLLQYLVIDLKTNKINLLSRLKLSVLLHLL